MGALLIAADDDEVARNALENYHALVTRAVEEEALAEIVSVVVNHQLG